MSSKHKKERKFQKQKAGLTGSHGFVLSTSALSWVFKPTQDEMKETQNPGLWKSMVLPLFCQNLQYIPKQNRHQTNAN